MAANEVTSALLLLVVTTYKLELAGLTLDGQALCQSQSNSCLNLLVWRKRFIIYIRFKLESKPLFLMEASKERILNSSKGGVWN